MSSSNLILLQACKSTIIALSSLVKHRRCFMPFFAKLPLYSNNYSILKVCKPCWVIGHVIGHIHLMLTEESSICLCKNNYVCMSKIIRDSEIILY